MNLKQKWTLGIAGITFVLSCVFAPWEVTVRDGNDIQHSETTAEALWAAPAVEYGTARLRVEVLVLEWAALAILATSLVLLCRGGGQRTQNEHQPAASIKPHSETPARKSKGETESVNLSKRKDEEVDPVEKVVLHWIILFVVAVGCAGYLAHLRYLGGDRIAGTPSLAISEAVGVAVALIAGPLLISALFKKSHRFLVRLVGLITMFVLNWYWLNERSKPAAEFVKEVENQRDQWKNDFKQQLDLNGKIQVDLSKADKTAAALEEGARKLDGKPKAIVEAMLSVDSKMRALATRYEIATKNFTEAGGATASTMQTIEQIQSRENLAVEVKEANSLLIEFLSGIDIHLNSALSKAGLTLEESEDAIQSYKKGANIEIVLAIRKLDMQITKDMIMLINLLKREFGNWRTHGKNVIFDRSIAATNFNAVGKRIDDAFNKQVELQKQFVK